MRLTSSQPTMYVCRLARGAHPPPPNTPQQCVVCCCASREARSRGDHALSATCGRQKTKPNLEATKLAGCFKHLLQCCTMCAPAPIDEEKKLESGEQGATTNHREQQRPQRVWWKGRQLAEHSRRKECSVGVRRARQESRSRHHLQQSLPTCMVCLARRATQLHVLRRGRGKGHQKAGPRGRRARGGSEGIGRSGGVTKRQAGNNSTTFKSSEWRGGAVKAPRGGLRSILYFRRRPDDANIQGQGNRGV